MKNKTYRLISAFVDIKKEVRTAVLYKRIQKRTAELIYEIANEAIKEARKII